MKETTQVEKTPETLLNELFPKEFGFNPKSVVRDVSFDLGNFYITDGSDGAFELKKPVNPKVKKITTYQISIDGEAIIRVKVQEEVLNSSMHLIENYVETKKSVIQSIAPYFNRFKIVECRTALSPSLSLIRTGSHGSYYTFSFKGIIAS